MGPERMLRKPSRYTRAACCASVASGASRLRVRTTASPISRMLRGSLAEGHDAHQHSAARACHSHPVALDAVVKVTAAPVLG